MAELTPEKIRRLARKQEDGLTLRPPWGGNANRWAAEVAGVLRRHYPKWRWGVGVWSDQGVVVIMNLDVQTDWKIVIRMDDIDYPDFKIVMRQAGEFLERCGIPTTAQTTPEWTEYAPKKALTGDVRVDITGVPTSNL